MRKTITAIAIGLMLALGSWLALLGTASAKSNSPGMHRHAATVHAVHAVHTTQSSSGEPSTDGTSSSESSTDGTSSGETDTHQDPDGQDVNHECPPNCDTASGEQP
jgi:hypothetical protein